MNMLDSFSKQMTRLRWRGRDWWTPTGCFPEVEICFLFCCCFVEINMMFLSWEIHFIKEEKLDWRTPNGYFLKVELCFLFCCSFDEIDMMFLSWEISKKRNWTDGPNGPNGCFLEVCLSSLFASSAINFTFLAMGSTLSHSLLFLLPQYMWCFLPWEIHPT